MLMGLYGANWFAGLYNRATDNAGGQTHEAYFRFVQITTFFTPVILLLQGARLYNAFDRTLDVDIADQTDTCLNSLCTSSRHFYYMPYHDSSPDLATNDAYQVRITDGTYMDHLALYFFSVLWSIGVSYNTYPSIRQEYNDAVAALNADHEDAGDSAW